MDHCDKLSICCQIFQNRSLLTKNQEIHKLQNTIKQYSVPEIIYSSLEEYNNLFTKMIDFISIKTKEFLSAYINNDYIFQQEEIRNIDLTENEIDSIINIISKGMTFLFKNEYDSWKIEFLNRFKIVLRSFIKSEVYYVSQILNFVKSYINDFENDIINSAYFKCNKCNEKKSIIYFVYGYCDKCYNLGSQFKK